VSDGTKVIVVAILAWLADVIGFKWTRNGLLVWLGCKAVGELTSLRAGSRNVARCGTRTNSTRWHRS
jgi:hypothetical protein